MRKIDLYEHNRQADIKVEKMLDEEGKAAVIHPTGTGKSFISFSVIQNHADKRFFLLAPTEYIYNLQVEKLWQKQHVRFDNVEFHTYAWLARNICALKGEAGCDEVCGGGSEDPSTSRLRRSAQDDGDTQARCSAQDDRAEGGVALLRTTSYSMNSIGSAQKNGVKPLSS